MLFDEGVRATSSARRRGGAYGTRFRMQFYLECYCACRRHQGCHRMKRRLRYVADFWAALGQAAACQYSVMWGVGRKEQWRVEKITCYSGSMMAWSGSEASLNKADKQPSSVTICRCELFCSDSRQTEA